MTLSGQTQPGPPVPLGAAGWGAGRPGIGGLRIGDEGDALPHPPPSMALHSNRAYSNGLATLIVVVYWVGGGPCCRCGWTMPSQRSHPTDHRTAEDNVVGRHASLPQTVIAQIQILEAAKERALQEEDYDKAKVLKQNIQDLMVSHCICGYFSMGACLHVQL